MATISTETFRFAALEVRYRKYGEMTLSYEAPHRIYWLMLERGDVVESYVRADFGKSLPIPRKIRFALWLKAKREGLIDLNQQDYMP